MANLKIQNLSIKFGGLKALTDLTLEVPSNSFTGLMGPNGAGKTTVLNCISRVYHPQAGSIHFDGVNLLKLRGDEILQLGIARTFQDLNFFNQISDMLIIDYMKLGQFNPLNNHLIKDSLQFEKSKNQEINLKKKARRVLEFFRNLREEFEEPQEERNYPYLHGREGFSDLLDLEFRPIGTLSFAWRRRLDLARALVSSPKLLLLDEPAQGLPPSEIENLGKTLKKIQTELGISALIVEHNVTTLSKISDKLVAMNQGQNITDGTPDEVMNNPEVINIYLGSKTSSNESSAVRKSLDDQVLLELKNIDLYYGNAQALYSVSLKVRRKQVSTILGTNGSGKSTLLKTIAGTEKPAFGEIIFEGEKIPLGWPEANVNRGIQYVPQGHVIFPGLTVYENLKIGSISNKKKGFNFNSSLERVIGYFPILKEVLNLPASSLSGGQQQMLAIGQAIMSKPKLLLLDEPSLGLSPFFVETLFKIIKRISVEEQCAIILVEQDVTRALEVSDYVYMMNSGVLVAEGSKHLIDLSVVKKHLGFN